MRKLFAVSSLRTRIMSALALASAGTAAILLVGTLWIVNGIIARADHRELRGHYDALQTVLQQQTRQAAAMSAVVASIPAVQQAMAHDDRAALMALFGAGIQALKSDYGVEQFQFHTAPATSFLRIHQPEKFGDDLSSFRKTVVQANAANAPVLGLESGVAGLGVRGVVPVDLAGKQIGTVEFGLSFGQPFFDQFKQMRHVDVAFHLPDKAGFKTFGGTLGGRSVFGADDYSNAIGGDFQVRDAMLDARPVAALLGPIHDFSGKAIGVVELVMDNTDYEASVAQARQTAIGIAIVALAIASLVGWLLARGIARPIRAITDVLGQLANGNHDVVVPQRRSDDEVGRMAQAVEVLRVSAIERVRLLGAQHSQTAEVARWSALVNMAESIESKTTEEVERISRRTDALAASAAIMHASADRTGASAGGAASSAAEARLATQWVASAAEQLAGSIREINSQIAQSTALVGEAMTTSAETRTAIEALNQEVARIGSVAEMINEIASRTNLLALNATIEAARAGDAGKGFAVVAGEVKQLATQTAHSTGEIGRHIARVRSATATSVAAVARIEQAVIGVNAIASSIAAAVEEQGAATAEIARNVNETAVAAKQVTNRIAEVSAEAAETGRHAVEVGETVTGLAAAVAALRRMVVHVVRTSSSEVDRRKDRRRTCLTDATIIRGGQHGKAVIRDISEGGCFIETSVQCQVGQQVDLVLSGFNHRLAGTVANEVDGGLHIAFAVPGLTAAEADRISLETIADMVGLCKKDHVAFVENVVKAVDAGEKRPPDSLPTPHHCRLGRWYDRVSDPATQALPSFIALDEPHHTVHDAGRRALAASGLGDTAGATREVTAMRAASALVQTALDAFGQEYPSTIDHPDQARHHHSGARTAA